MIRGEAVCVLMMMMILMSRYMMTFDELPIMRLMYPSGCDSGGSISEYWEGRKYGNLTLTEKVMIWYMAGNSDEWWEEEAYWQYYSSEVLFRWWSVDTCITLLLSFWWPSILDDIVPDGIMTAHVAIVKCGEENSMEGRWQAATIDEGGILRLLLIQWWWYIQYS